MVPRRFTIPAQYFVPYLIIRKDDPHKLLFKWAVYKDILESPFS